jgi:hypothetical protein
MAALRITIILIVVAVIYLWRVTLLALGCVVYIYLLPGVLAEKKNYPRYQQIYLLCALGGWLLVPWVVALVWAKMVPPVLDETTAELEGEIYRAPARVSANLHPDSTNPASQPE